MSKMSTPAKARDNVFSRREIEGMLAENKLIVIVDGNVLRLDAWIKYHPGGDMAIKHMIGKDATDEVNALHSQEARDRMIKFKIGRVEGYWTNFLPPIQGGKFRPLIENEIDEEDLESPELSSEEISAPPSPIFEAEDEKLGLRRRLSVSTISSAVSAVPPPTEDKPRAYVIDARTREEIEMDSADYPALDAEHQAYVVKRYRELHVRIREAGLFNCNYRAYAIEISRYALFFGLFVFFLKHSWYCLSAFFLGCFWHQLVFSAHDAGHMGITHNYQIDTTIGMIIADYLGGLSLGWWKRSHNVHHIVTNAPEHDPDIELMPFFALSHRFFSSLYSTYYDRVMTYDAVAQVTVKYQHYLYYPILLFGRFNLYFLSWEHIIVGRGPKHGAGWWHRWFEFAGHIFFWIWFGYGVVWCSIPTWFNRVVFVLISHMVTSPLHVQITLSHYAMSTADLGPLESFPQKMLRTTMDVDCPPWLDFFHGGLQFQAIHHLYPRIPRHNLRKTQQFVREFCEDVKIPYAVFTFYDGNKEVISRLAHVSRQARLLEECRKACAADPHMH
ncbi:Fatty acid/sphingolipid desaturase [Penicillium concentricum]|uniref:Delta 8-(E)-sphingolipid desaturase n=1 Tax=Penicillium concentricum TaxID=293559 RepID=A0A9W9R9S6_9EURO|nr:Fatty acid/sphingolipid desaturase [Penicillium concentricum]KAJ5356312.1 Fatty acid/sphingolipid desaturase [Penicillium concentricum]